MLIFISLFLVVIPLSALQRYSQISPELKTRKLYAAEFKELGVEFLSALQTQLDRTKIIPRKKFFLPPGQEKWGPLLEKHQCELMQEITQQYQAALYIKFINDKVGFGVFADAPIKVGDSISEYTGILCVEDDSTDERKDLDFAIDVGNYYASESGTALYVDAGKSGNFSRFINHSFVPNVCSISVYNTNDGLWHVMMHANKDIPKDAQLLTNYGIGYWNSRNIEPIDLHSNP